MDQTLQNRNTKKKEILNVLMGIENIFVWVRTGDHFSDLSCPGLGYINRQNNLFYLKIPNDSE